MKLRTKISGPNFDLTMLFWMIWFEYCCELIDLIRQVQITICGHPQTRNVHQSNVRFAYEWGTRRITTGLKHGHERFLCCSSHDHFGVVGKSPISAFQRRKNHVEWSIIALIYGHVLMQPSFAGFLIHRCYRMAQSRWIHNFRFFDLRSRCKTNKWKLGIVISSPVPGHRFLCPMRWWISTDSIFTVMIRFYRSFNRLFLLVFFWYYKL